uniref:uncharacterized protein LOC118531724 isoform X7 n=1 Tax=Halichoerus grypus TaxID=9711 RepID=UPI001659CA04|nr:uncharacterized protein LOC118531724 isoform X7 [Halichoerus grypus]
MEFLEVNLRVSPRLKQPGVFPLTPVHTQLPAIHQNYHDVFLPPVYDSSRSAPACRALRISLENVQICSLHCMSGRPYEHQLEFAIERNTFVIPELRQLQYSISHKIWLFTRIGLLCVGCA